MPDRNGNESLKRYEVVDLALLPGVPCPAERPGVRLRTWPISR